MKMCRTVDRRWLSWNIFGLVVVQETAQSLGVGRKDWAATSDKGKDYFDLRTYTSL